jgi:hypothetical protein
MAIFEGVIMKTLAARMAMSEAAKNAMRAAAIAVPMVLVECGGAPKNDTRPAPVVVVEAPKTTQGEGMKAAGSRVKPEKTGHTEKQAQKQTLLRIHFYPDCIVEAHLSVVNPDNSLDRVILDPQVNFSWTPSGVPPYHGLGCDNVPQCDVSGIVSKHGRVSGFPEIKAEFVPPAGSGLAPAVHTYVLMPAEVAEYCPRKP